jgi:hypothetical protein
VSRLNNLTMDGRGIACYIMPESDGLGPLERREAENWERDMGSKIEMI